METWHFVWLLAAVTGIVAAGIAGSGWVLVTGDRPRIWMLATYSVSMPIKLVALIIYAPLALIRAGLSYLDQNPLLGFAIAGAGLLWSFVQGAFILTTFFGFT